MLKHRLHVCVAIHSDCLTCVDAFLAASWIVGGLGAKSVLLCLATMIVYELSNISLNCFFLLLEKLYIELVDLKRLALSFNKL